MTPHRSEIERLAHERFDQAEILIRSAESYVGDALIDLPTCPSQRMERPCAPGVSLRTLERLALVHNAISIYADTPPNTPSRRKKGSWYREACYVSVPCGD